MKKSEEEYLHKDVEVQRSNNELPQGWRWSTLGSVANYGLTEKVEPEDISPNDWILELEDIEKDSSTIMKKVDASLRLPQSTKNAFRKGDVLYGKLRPYLRKVIIANDCGYCSTEILPLRGNGLLDNSFLFHFLKTKQFTEYAINISHGMNMPRLGTDQGRSAPIPLPPLLEQQRIAARLDLLLGKLKTARKSLDAMPELIKRFRKSVLAEAVSGRLTQEWREEHAAELPSAEELSALVETKAQKKGYEIDRDFVPVECPSSWIIQAIGCISDFQQGMQIAKSTRHKEGGPGRLPILRIQNYANHFTESVDFADINENSLIAEPDDVILTRTGETRGKVLTGYRGIFHNNTFRINYAQDIICKGYLILWLDSESVQLFILEKSGRSAQPDLTHSAFGPCPIPLPSLPEQAEIVRRVDELFAYANALEKQVTEARALADRLEPSILAKAFRGELSEQIPEEAAEWERTLAEIEAAGSEMAGKVAKKKRAAADAPMAAEQKTDYFTEPRKRGRPRKNG
jgi:type I restriction enzyme, S subunit